MARRGTEAFPDLGAHCDKDDCNQLDFLPFTCDGCGNVFCTEHRTYRDHGCAKAADNGRTVVVCETCGDAIERLAGQKEKDILDTHERSQRCDPARKQKPRCPVRRCKEALTFSNTSKCKGCGQKVCLKHRFSTDHDCATIARAAPGAAAAKRARECSAQMTKKRWLGAASVRPELVF